MIDEAELRMALGAIQEARDELFRVEFEGKDEDGEAREIVYWARQTLEQAIDRAWTALGQIKPGPPNLRLVWPIDPNAPSIDDDIPF